MNHVIFGREFWRCYAIWCVKFSFCVHTIECRPNMIQRNTRHHQEHLMTSAYSDWILRSTEELITSVHFSLWWYAANTDHSNNDTRFFTPFAHHCPFVCSKKWSYLDPRMDKLEVVLEVTKLDLNEFLLDSIQIDFIAMMLMPQKTKSQKIGVK